MLRTRFPLSCLESLFNWFSLIIVPPRGAWASQVAASLPRHCRAIPLRNQVDTRRRAPKLIFGAPGASKSNFWPLQLPTVFRTCSWRLPGSILVPFLPQKLTCFAVFFRSREVFVSHCFSVDFCHAYPLKCSRFGRCAKKAHMASDPQKPMVF